MNAQTGDLDRRARATHVRIGQRRRQPPRRRAIAASIAMAMAAASAGALLVPLPARAGQAHETVAANVPALDFTIPAGPLDTALSAFAVQSGAHVNYSPGLVAGKTTHGVSGNFLPAAALQVLLRTTGLTPVRIGKATFVLRPDPPGDPARPVPQSTSAAQAPPAASSNNPKTLQTIVVTGSHIARVDIETANPVVRISAQAIQRTGDLTLGDVVQHLSVFTGPNVNPNVNNGGGSGATVVGLRGLGGGRTLVLVDGQRVISRDLNAIPSSAVERVEVLTNGASSVYGSDAIGGVINVILKSHYQGAQFQAEYGISSRDDGQRRGASFMFGQTSDKGSILAGVGYNKTAAIPELARDFSKYTLSITGSENKPLSVFHGGSSFTPRGFIALPTKQLQAQFGCKFVSLNKDVLGGSNPTTLADYHCFNNNQDRYSWSDIRPITTPQERTDGYFRGIYHLTNDVDFNATILHSKTDSGFDLGPPVWGTLVGAVLSKDSMYNPFGVDFTPSNGQIFRSRLVPLSNRFTGIATTRDQVMVGFRGHLELFGGQDWTWDIGYDYGHSSTLINVGGLAELPKLLPGLGPSMLVNGVPSCVSTPGDPSTVIPGCVPWDTFNLQNPQSLAVLTNPDQTNPALEQSLDIERIKHVDVSGGLFDLPAGTVQLALGASWREEYTSGVVDPVLLINEQGTCTFSSQCAAPLHGGFSVKEAYAELFIPVLKDLPFIHALNVDLGDRYSKFSNFGSTNNWKIGVEYRPIQDLLLRGTVSKVFRAPTIGDIFGQPGAFGDTLSSDPCDHITVANPACVGVPLDGTFVNTQVANHQQTSVLASGSAFAGFPLGPESGKSFDFGVVYSPHFLPGFSVSVDTWRIYLNNVITNVSDQTVLNACFNGVTKFCPLIERFGANTANPGQFIRILLPTVNLGRIDVKGTDMQASYTLPNLPIGQFEASLQATYMDQDDVETAPGVPGNQVINGAGIYNLDVGTLGFLPRVRAQGALNWQLGPWNASLRLHYIGPWDLGSHVVDRGFSAVPGFQQPYVLHYGARTLSDITVGYEITPLNTRFDVGVNNVSDKQPPILYENNIGSGNANTSGNNFSGGVIGRFYWARVTVKF